MKVIILFLIAILINFHAFSWPTPTISSPSNGSTAWTGVVFNWNAVSGSDFYEIQIDTSSNFNSPLFQDSVKAYINSSSGNSDTRLSLPNLRFGETYYWRVRAWITGDTSAWTQRTIQTRDGINLSFPNDNATTWAGVGFNWAPHDGIDFYEIQVDTSANFNSPAFQNDIEAYISTTNGNVDTYEFIDDMLFGETYFWRVRAINSADTSGWTQRTIQTRDDIDLSFPNDNATTWAGVGFNWAPHDGVDFYEIQVDTSANFNSPAFQNDIEAYISTTNGNVDTYEFIDDMLFGETYFWRVRAINSADTSGWTQRTIQTRDDIDLSFPNDNATTWAGVGFNWAPHDGVDFYEIQVDTSANFNSPAFQNDIEAYISTTNGNVDTYEFIDDMLFGETYFWRVRAINSADTSGWTQRTIQTRDNVDLSFPNDFAVNVSTANVQLNWDPHDGVDFYELELDTTNIFNSNILINFLKTYISTTNGNGDTFESISNLLNNQTYFWRVRAINAVDTTSWTSRVFSTAPNIFQPDIPTLLTPINNANNISNNPVIFDWLDANNAINYEIQYSLTNNFSNATSQNSLVSNFSINNLQYNTLYYWRVRSINGGYYSNWSNAWEFTTETAPCTTTASNIDTTACLSYTSPSGLNTWTIDGNYQDTITNVNGCDSIITINLDIITIDTVVNISGITLIVNGSNGSYQWLDCDDNYQPILGETAQTYTPITNGSYAVEISESVCKDTSFCYSIFSVGFDENQLGASLNVFPNPTTSGQITIELNKFYDHLILSVVNSKGQLMNTYNYEKSKVLLVDLIGPPGYYLLSIESTDDNRSATLKILKE